MMASVVFCFRKGRVMLLDNSRELWGATVTLGSSSSAVDTVSSTRPKKPLRPTNLWSGPGSQPSS